eukprot:sb/3465639/
MILFVECQLLPTLHEKTTPPPPSRTASALSQDSGFAGDQEEQSPKKHRSSHASLKKLGSALHASFRKIRGKEDSGYETLPKKMDHCWERRSFRNLLRTSKKWLTHMPVACLTNPSLPGKPPHSDSTPDHGRSNRRKVSQSETCLLLGSSDKRQIEHLQRNFRGPTKISDTSRAISNSSASGISVPISIYSDYEIPDEVLEASTRQETLLSQSSLTVPSSLCKSLSDYQISDRSQMISRRRANSEFTVVERSGSIARIRSGKSMSEILGAPPAIPTTRRPSILCSCCGGVHANLPGMSLTHNTFPVPCNHHHNPINQKQEDIEEDGHYDTVPVGESDYETLDQITSLTHVTTDTVTLTLDTGMSELSISPDISSSLDYSLVLE